MVKHWSLAELYVENSNAIQDRYGINETDGKGTASKAESGQWGGHGAGRGRIFRKKYSYRARIMNDYACCFNCNTGCLIVYRMRSTDLC